MSSATSYVAIEERSGDERTDERAELREIPVALTKGWGGGRIGGPAMHDMMADAAVLGDVHACLSPPEPGDVRYSAAVREEDTFCEGEVLSHRMYREERRPPPGRASRMFRSRISDEDPAIPPLFLAQRADGSWDLTAELAAECGLDLDDLRAAAGEIGHADGERVLATLLVLILAERRLPPDQVLSLKLSLFKGANWWRTVMKGRKPPTGDWKSWAASLIDGA
jgi:hypothetical protein